MVSSKGERPRARKDTEMEKEMGRGSSKAEKTNIKKLNDSQLNNLFENLVESRGKEMAAMHESGESVLEQTGTKTMLEDVMAEIARRRK